MSTTVGFIGAGAMATALISGLINSNTVIPSNVHVSDPSSAALTSIQSAMQVHTTTDNTAVVSSVKVVVLAVKPGVVPIIVKQIAPFVTPQHLLVSIAAGVTTASIEALLPSGSKVVRVMPNTPSLVQKGASVYALGSNCDQKDGDIVKRLLLSVGIAHPLDESKIDAVTGLSGSGPAYVFMFIEALADGGVRAGLARPVAHALAAQTVLGAAQMVVQGGRHTGQLKDAVASPGGTTIAGIHALEQRGFRGACMDAVYAAYQRARQLSKL